MINADGLRLMPFTKAHFLAILEGDCSKLAEMLEVKAFKQWTEFAAAQEAIHSLFEIYNSLQGDWRWGSYFIIQERDNCLVGTCGFKGKPSEDNSVEIGYEINSSFQGQGFATEATRALSSFAFSRHVDKVIAHTLAEDNHSTRVLLKCNFKFVMELNDPEDGVIWKWRLDKGGNAIL